MRRINLNLVISRTVPRNKASQLPVKDWEKLKSASEIILALVATAGTITIAAIAPNLFQVIPMLYKRRSARRSFSNEETQRVLYKSFYYLKRSGCIKMKQDKDGFKIWLTHIGRKKVSVLNFDRLSIPRPRRWNRHWWEVAADIPTKNYKNAADMLRWKLKQMKFCSLQRTIWFYPYDPRKELEFVIHHYGIEKFVTAMEVSRLDKADERLLKSHFQKHHIL